MLKRLRGSITALVTPFRNNVFDEDSFRKFINWQLENGTHGLVPVGTTGECPTLSHVEHEHVVAVCVKETAGRVPVIAGAGSNSTTEAIAFAKHAEKVGADAVLVVTPYYNKPTQEGMYQHFKAINDAIGIPILIYNVPARSIVDMSVDTMARLYELKNIVGIKDATANVARVSVQRQVLGHDFIQISGEDGTALGFNAQGGVGCISVTANVAPRLCSEMQDSCLAGNWGKALSIHDRLTPLNTNLFVEVSPGPVKFAVSELGLMKEEIRLPLVPVSEQTRKLVRSAMAHAGLLNTVIS